jgi:hypothetical protein
MKDFDEDDWSQDDDVILSTIRDTLQGADPLDAGTCKHLVDYDCDHHGWDEDHVKSLLATTLQISQDHLYAEMANLGMEEIANRINAAI